MPYDGVRGRTIIAVICDEMAFWPHEETAANPEEEVIAALRPGMIAVTNPKLVKISTPFAKQGLLWTDFQQRTELDFPVWQLPSHEMNPKISLSESNESNVVARRNTTFGNTSRNLSIASAVGSLPKSWIPVSPAVAGNSHPCATGST